MEYFEILGPIEEAETFAVGKSIRELPPASENDYGASLETRKLYEVLPDPDAEANGLIRVMDESGEDYLYPAEFFRRLALPGEVQRALGLAS